MKISTKLEYYRITISEPMIRDTYHIEQGDDGRYYITSDNGYNGYEANGHKSIESAMKQVKAFIKMYFNERCEDNPIGW